MVLNAFFNQCILTAKGVSMSNYVGEPGGPRDFSDESSLVKDLIAQLNDAWSLGDNASAVHAVDALKEALGHNEQQ